MRLRFNRPRSLATRACPLAFGLAMRDDGARASASPEGPWPRRTNSVGATRSDSWPRATAQKVRRFRVGSCACGGRVRKSAQAGTTANATKTTVTARLNITASNDRGDPDQIHDLLSYLKTLE